MKQRQLTGLSALLLMTCFLTATVEAKERPELQGREILKEVNLTKEQKEKLQTLKEADKGKLDALRAEKREHKQKLEQAMSSASSKEELLKLHTQLKEVDTQLDRARFEQILKIRELLTAEQRKKFKEIRDSRRRKLKDTDEDEGE